MMNRQNFLQRLATEREWDILIVGGGATGLGAAVDAASRGFKTLLVEQADFGKGTSGRSTKLVHGGVRYLAQGNIKLVREALKERGILLKNAPHVCHNRSFIIPSYRWWQKWYYAIGLWGYDRLSGKYSLGKTAILSRQEMLATLPSLSGERLTGGVSYQDGQFDDARLAINLAQTASEQGAVVLNYCKLQSFTKTSGRLSGAVLQDTLTGINYQVNARCIINATGIFTDQVMQLDEPAHVPVISLSQGVHVVVDAKFFSGQQALMIPKTDDGRVLFAVPWHNKVVLGTTDTGVQLATLEPRPLQDEIDFIIQHINRYLKQNIQSSDVCAVFAGLRPLMKVTGQKLTAILPRDFSTLVSKSGLITITGGKWTTYRKMGESAIDNAIFSAKLDKRACVTRSLPIHGGGDTYGDEERLAFYGSDLASIRALMQAQPALAQPIHDKFPYPLACVTWAVQEELACRVEDVLARRTRMLVLDAAAAIAAAPRVATLMAEILGRDEAWIATEVRDFTGLAAHYQVQ